MSPGTDEQDHFRNQELKFGKCSPAATGEADLVATPPTESMKRAECAKLRVPLDYADPDGRVAEIAMLRIPARGGNPQGSILLNPGGPGGSGTTLAPTLAETWASNPITAQFDLIGFDPRGVGGSTPGIHCYTDAEREKDAPLFTPMSGVNEFTDASAKAFVAQCAERSGGADVLAHVGTKDVARDMDLMREVLGDEKLTYAGLSYGTRLGAVYAQMFPQNVRALVLDGAIDPTVDKLGWRVSLFSGVQKAFDGMVKMCVQQANCPLGTDPDKALDSYLDLVRGLDAHPATTKSGRELNTVKAMDGVFAALYDSSSWHLAIEGLQEVRGGSGALLMAIRDQYHARSVADGSYKGFLEANVAIDCIDDDRLTREKETAFKRAVLDAAPFLDPGHTVATSDPCAAWPGGDPVRMDAGDVSDALPQTLVVSTTHDPATPYQDGLALADVLGSSLLTVEGAKHGVIPDKNPCIGQVMADYLIDLELPADGTRCTL